jgi:hypothetical protein
MAGSAGARAAPKALLLAMNGNCVEALSFPPPALYNIDGMKRRLLPVLVALFLLVSLAGAGFLEAQRRFFGNRNPMIYEANEPPDTEFVFIRLRYNTHGGSWGMSGWEHDYPQAEWHINTLAREATVLDIERMSYKVLDMDDPELFNYPFAYISEPGTMNMTDAELKNFKEYLDRGGFVMVDDFNGYNDLSNWDYNLKRMYPGREMIPLTVDHPIFHTFYDITDLDLTAIYVSEGWPVFYGYPSEDGKNISMIICYNNDLGDYWEWLDQPRYPLQPSAEGVRLGINFLIYSMTH